MSKIRGNKTLSGTWGEVWVDGEKIFELSKVELKITANREDVQLGLDVDSKMTGLKGELTLTTKRCIPGITPYLRTGKRASTSAARSLPSWQTRTPWAGRSSAIAAIISGLTSCPSSPWKWVVLSSRRLAAALPRPTL